MNFDPQTGQPLNNNQNNQPNNGYYNNYQNNYQQQGYYPQQPKPTNTIAIVGFVLSLLQFGIISLILSIVGLSRSKEINGEGKGFAIAGIIISVLHIIIVTAVVIIAVVFYQALWPSIRSDLEKSTSDKAFQLQLMKEYGIID